MSLHPRRAREAASALSRKLGSGARGARTAAESTAEAVLEVANATMLRAIRVVSVERGHDPADFALVAFGGAAPLHAVGLARALGIRRVLVPVDPGVLCARGLLSAPIIRDFSRTVLSRAAGPSRGRGTSGGQRAELSLIEREFKRMEKLALAYLSAEGARGANAHIQRYVDVRYVGQSYEITVPYGRGFRDAFHAEHEQLYGHSSPERETEVVTVRVRAIGAAAHWRWMVARSRRKPAVHASTHPARRVETYASGRLRATPLYERAWLLPGARLLGPALVVEESSTTYVPGDAKCSVDAHGNLILET